MQARCPSCRAVDSVRALKEKKPILACQTVLGSAAVREDEVAEVTAGTLKSQITAGNVPTLRLTGGMHFPLTSDRTFPVAAARAWNSLPAQIRAASSLLSFRRQTKAHLFQLSYN